MSDRFNNGPDFLPEKEIAASDLPCAAFDMKILRRGRRWKWQVFDDSGIAIMYGWEKNRSTARYCGYRTLFLLLRASCLSNSALRK